MEEDREENCRIVRGVVMGERLVLYIVENKGGDLYRYQVENVMDSVSGDKEWRVECYAKSEIERAKKKLEEASLVVILRQTAKDKTVLNFIKEAKGKGVKVVFLLDDLVFDYKYLPMLMWSTNSKNVLYWAGYFWGIRRIAKRVDGFVVTNDYLGKRIKACFGKSYVVISNSLGRKQVEVSEKCLAKNREEKEKGFWLGYFSGSPTHAKDFRMIEGQVLRFLREVPESKLLVVGYMNFSAEASEMIGDKKIIFRKRVNPIKLQELMGEVDVNLAPLLVNSFTNCKSELKFFEAGVVETTTVASPSYVYRRVIKNGKNGMVAKKNEWYDKIKYLYDNPEKNKRMAMSAREDAMKNYYGEGIKKKVEKAFADLVGKD